MDQDLVVRVQHGDRQAFEALATADYPRSVHFAHGVLSDRSLAEDAIQQALLDIWRDIRRLHDPAKYEGWSYRLLVRVCYAEAKCQPRWTPSANSRQPMNRAQPRPWASSLIGTSWIAAFAITTEAVAASEQ